MDHAAPLSVFAALFAFAVTVRAGPVPAPELRAFAASAEHELRGNILPFWLAHTRNRANDGFYGVIDADMKAEPEAPRGALLTCRVLWTFSKAYSVYHDPQYLAMAQWAYRDLTAHFMDPADGGIYWTITAAGKPLETFKQVYVEAFAVYALAEYFHATGDSHARDQAVAIYRLIETHARDRQHGGYLDALDRHWRPMAQNLLGDGPKSQNSHIHILEAYSNLLRVWPDPGLKASQRQLIEITLDRIIDPRTHHLILFQKEDWSPLSDAVSYGHDIELSWLLMEAAQGVGDPALIARCQPVSLAIASATLAEGVDRDGAVLNEGGPHGYTNTDKDWWPQAEGVVGFLNAYQLSGDARFLVASRRTWDVIEQYFVDRQHGDWIERISRDDHAMRTAKVTLWKCPYHSSRSCFEVMERAEQLARQ